MRASVNASSMAYELRHMADENTEPDEETWQNQPHYDEVVPLLKRDMALELQELTDETPCFGHAWRDEDGECPDAVDCDLASFCKQAWNMVQVTIGQNTTAPVVPPPKPQVVPVPVNPEPNPYVEAHKGSIAKTSRKRPLGKDTTKKTRNKFKNSDKYTRKGYEDLGRTVDDLVAEFIEELGDPPRMPLVWNATNFDKKFSELGPVVVSAPRNYHTVIHEGTTVVRFWTNAARHAIVDLVPELVHGSNELAVKLGAGRGGRSHMDAPVKVSEKSLTKAAPCTHRVIVRTKDAAKELAQLVRKQYSF